MTMYIYMPSALSTKTKPWDDWYFPWLILDYFFHIHLGTDFESTARRWVSNEKNTEIWTLSVLHQFGGFDMLTGKCCSFSATGHMKLGQADAQIDGSFDCFLCSGGVVQCSRSRAYLCFFFIVRQELCHSIQRGKEKYKQKRRERTPWEQRLPSMD